MIKTEVIFLILVMGIFNTKAQNPISSKSEIEKGGFLSYKIYHKTEISDLYQVFNSLENLQKTLNNDSIQVQNKDTLVLTELEKKKKMSVLLKKIEDKNNPIYKLLSKSVNTANNITKSDDTLLKESKHSSKYFLYNDTIKYNETSLNGIITKTIAIPKKFKRFREATHSGKTHRDVITLKEIYKKWGTKYEIKVDKNDTKKILNLEGYKVIITEKRRGTFDVNDVYELYITNTYKYPLIYYPFLELKEDLPLNGLILECKTYDASIPKSYTKFQLSEFNNNRQDPSLIKINERLYKKM